MTKEETKTAQAYIEKLLALIDECPPNVKVVILNIAEDDEGLHMAWSCCEKCAYNMLDEAKDYVETLVADIAREQQTSVN
jgi:hypothetical protein